jgi:hypothetical protein
MENEEVAVAVPRTLVEEIYLTLQDCTEPITHVGHCLYELESRFPDLKNIRICSKKAVLYADSRRSHSDEQDVT